jgi:cytochrome c peroxidase
MQPIIPLTSEIEMNGDAILVMMKGDKTYRELFKVSFMTALFLLRTCSKHFLNLWLCSSNSKFDHYRRNEGTLILTKQLVMPFNTKCASCHATDLMTDDA